MHVGSGTTASKIDAMYYPTSTGSYEDGDTAPFRVSGPGGKYPGFVSSTKELKYLGPIVHPPLMSDADVRKAHQVSGGGLWSPMGRAL